MCGAWKARRQRVLESCGTCVTHRFSVIANVVNHGGLLKGDLVNISPRATIPQAARKSG